MSVFGVFPESFHFFKIFYPARRAAQGFILLQFLILPAQPQDLILLQFLTQSQSATVYFFCTISYTVAVCDCVFLLYDFLHSRSLRLCISSVRFLSYPAGAAAGSYIASVSSSSSFFFFFFFLSTSLFLLQLTWYDHVTQVIFISLMTATKLMGLEIHLGSFGVTGVKKVNHVKNMKTALI